MQCEYNGCTNEFVLGHSFVLVLGGVRKGTEYGFVQPQSQKWTCGHAHARAQTALEIEELKNVPFAYGPSPFTTDPTQGITCYVCGTSLEGEAFWITLAYASPGPGFPGFICDTAPHMCCSREHAAQAAIECLEQHIEQRTGEYES